MQLFLRYQVENRAIAKWGSLEALDEEFEKRTTEKKKKKDAKFQQKLRELKRKTRASRIVGAGAGAAADGRGTVGKAGYAGKHDHVWGVAVDNGNGESVRTCEECGIEVEELVF